MTGSLSTDRASSGLQRLLSYLEADPKNVPLTVQIITTAMDEGLLEIAKERLKSLPEEALASPHLLNLQGLMALRNHDFSIAIDAFERVIASGNDDPAIRFNLAWAKGMVNDFAAAATLLDDAAMAVSPRAPALKIRALNHLRLYPEGLAEGARLTEIYPDNLALMAALATLAMDADEVELARNYASRSGDHPEGLAARGMLALDGADLKGSLALFEQALTQQERNPRAWIGKGLSLIALGDMDGATISLTKGAQLFGDHLGSWIAAGWAEFIRGDQKAAKTHFQTALSIDPNFAESHGGLAVIEVTSGNIALAKQHCEVALRLDRQCFGAALASSLILSGEGQESSAQKVREMAMATQIGTNGETLAQALVKLAVGREH